MKTLDTSLQCEQNDAQPRQNALVGYASAGFSFKGEGSPNQRPTLDADWAQRICVYPRIPLIPPHTPDWRRGMAF